MKIKKVIHPKTEFKKGQIPWNKGNHDYISGANNPFYGKSHTQEARLKMKKARAKQITPMRDTSIELKIQNFLKELKIEFYTHQYISEITSAYQCDIFIPLQEGINKKTIIECDGDYWHGNPSKYPEDRLNAAQREQREEDYIRTKELIESGFNVIRLWECDIRKMNIEDFKEISYVKINCENKRRWI